MPESRNRRAGGGRADLRYPVAAFYILIAYLLERFVYYGLFGGVVFYMQRVLQFSASTSSTWKAIIEGLIYLAPIAGAVLADTYLGKFRTVFSMCCIYIVGAFLFTLSSITPIMSSLGMIQGTGMSGILVLGLATGLMKAVYTSLGPDQFKVPEQRRQQQRYFSAFYWMINAGAFAGQMLTAQMRSSIQCFGDDCYMAPFLILSSVMVISTIVFYCGKKRYFEAPPDTMLLDSIKCLCYAGKKAITDRQKPTDHWIDRAGDKFDGKLIEDVKRTLRVLLVFVTFPFFWALFYQTSTGMIFQAKRLNDRIGSYRVPPELTSSINPFLILILIPLFEFVIYPFLNSKGIMKKTTTRMTVGLMLGCFSFLVYGTINISVEQDILSHKQAQLTIYNPQDCFASVRSEWLPEEIEVGPWSKSKVFPMNLQDEVMEYNMHFTCADVSEKLNVGLLSEHETTIVFSTAGVLILSPTQHYLKDKDAEAKARIISLAPSLSNESESSVTLKYGELVEKFTIEGHSTDFKKLSPKSYAVYRANEMVGNVDIKQDGVYDIILNRNESVIFLMTEPSDTHIGWLFPQYLIITTGELLFSVSSMDFAYTEAPTSMKSFMQAANLFTITIGLWLFALITKSTDSLKLFEYKKSNEAFTYAVGMFLNTIAFTVLSRYYLAQRKRFQEKVKTTETGKSNPAFQEEEI